MRISMSIDPYKAQEGNNLQIFNDIKIWLKKHGDDIVKREDKPEYEITFGGDSNLMRTASACSKLGIPVLSINAGNVGFLTYGHITDWEKPISEFLQGNFRIEERLGLMLKYGGKEFGPLVNDVYFEGSEGVPYYTIWKNDILVHDSLKANGVIVSTPTGSTGYNQGAGGPICEPDVQSIFIITTICPTVCNTRPLIVSDNSIIKIEVAPCRPPGSALLFGDGQKLDVVRDGGMIIVKKHPVKLKIVVLENSNFFLALQTKKGFRG